LSLFLPAQPPPDLYTLSLHDALPICSAQASSEALSDRPLRRAGTEIRRRTVTARAPCSKWWSAERNGRAPLTARSRLRSARAARSEEHTSELQSLRHLVCRLLLEKKK